MAAKKPRRGGCSRSSLTDSGNQRTQRPRGCGLFRREIKMRNETIPPVATRSSRWFRASRWSRSYRLHFP
jgi:hypothetical protein